MSEKREAVLYNTYEVTSDVLKVLSINIICVDIIHGLAKANFSKWLIEANWTELMREEHQDDGRYHGAMPRG